MTPLLLLAEKVEGLSGPDREVDCLIYAAVHIPADRAGKIDIAAPYVGCHPVDGPYVSAIEAPAYTASLDAAMTLVPEGCLFAIVNSTIAKPDKIGRATAMVVREGASKAADPVEAATPPLALCAASLRARAAMEAGDAGDD